MNDFLCRNYNFEVMFIPTNVISKEIDNALFKHYNLAYSVTQSRIQFKNISGLEITTDVLEYKEGGRNTNTLRFPGQKNNLPVTMEKGIGFINSLDDNFLYNWFRALESNINVTYTIIISLYDRIGNNINKVKQWRLENAWISDYKIRTLDATANDILIESITVQCDRIYNVFELLPTPMPVPEDAYFV